MSPGCRAYAELARRRARYWSNREVELDRQRVYRAENPRASRERKKVWNEENRERVRERERAIRAAELGRRPGRLGDAW
jgi:hypothetical protein